MIRPRRAVFVMALLIFPSFASAAPPTLTASSPSGVPARGMRREVTLRGTGRGDSPRLVAPFAFQLEESAGSGSDASQWKFRLTIDDRTAVGVYPIRVATEAGASGPILFAVGQVALGRGDRSRNNMWSTACRSQSRTRASSKGNVRATTWTSFGFKGRKDMHVVVDAACSRIGSGVDPQIRLTTGDGRLVASADDTPGLVTDGYLTAVLPEDGDYVLEFCDSRFAGTSRAALSPAGRRPSRSAQARCTRWCPAGSSRRSSCAGARSRMIASSPTGRQPTPYSRCFAQESPLACWTIRPGPIPTWTSSYSRRSP